MADENSSTTTNGFREDLLKLAASFLSSTKVQSAEKSKKVAFLKTKGLTDDEIEEAFRRLDQQGASAAATTTTSTTPKAIDTDSTSKQLSSSSPGLNFTPPPTALIPERPLEPLIVYHPSPTAPKVPSRQVFAMAVILGVGVTGVACGMVGIVKRLLYPVFATYAGYKHSRYKYHTTIAEKVQETLNKDIKEDKDQDELDTLDKPGIYQLVKDQETLVDRLNKIVVQTRTLRHSPASATAPVTASSSDPLAVLGESLKSLSETMALGLQQEKKESTLVSDMKGELRRLKGICLNRRHI
ncbi:peroxisomal membrane anchor protein conserved region-domain-containing protein [Absidia repens]|uniref:Peroxisomal membrane protein PEX14 n=1 Tax=Absidia repens TaxID=90262 RepID=A0A1X2J001_9FUNG|nr:peroxisomal membrane anchor protein conserved region-domain-containing protein [Absidia repens]